MMQLPTSSLLPFTTVIERRGRVVTTPALYSGGPGFEIWPPRPDILIEGFRGFPQPLQANDGHDCFLQNLFQFIIIHISPYHRRYIVYLLKKRRKINYQPALPVSFQT
jgi:hypothetical protein